MKNTIAAVVVATAMAVGLSAFAAEITWCGADGAAWDATTSWTGGVVPGAADTAVFDPGVNATNSVTFNAIQDICGVKILSGTVTLGVQGVTKKYLRMNGDANGVSEVYVAEGATNIVNCGMLPAEPNKTTFKKSGAGTIGFYGPLGDPDSWIAAGVRQGYALMDFTGGKVTTRKNGSIFYSTNVIIRTGATWDFQNWNTMLNGHPYVYLEKGASLLTYNAQDGFRGVEGYGLFSNSSVGSHAATVTLEGGPYRFDGKLGEAEVSDTGNSFNLTFGAQGTKSDDEYGFIVGNTNVLNGLSQINYSAEPSPRAVTNCPIKFAAGIGRFNFVTLNCKKDAPLLLEDLAGEPVDVYAQNLGDFQGTYVNANLFAVTGKGNFYVRHKGTTFRRWEIPFTNDCFTSTGEIGSYSDGIMTLGDGKEGHDPGLSTVSGLVAKDAKSQLVFNNYGAMTVPKLDVAGTLTHKAGAAPLTVSGPATGSGSFTLDAETTFNGPVELDGTVSVNAPTAFNNQARAGAFVLNAAASFAEDLEDCTFTVNFATTFERYVRNGTFAINAPTMFAKDVTEGGSFTIKAETAFLGDVLGGGTFTVKAPTVFAGKTELSGAFRTEADTHVEKLVTSEDDIVAFTQLRGLFVGADGKDAWVSTFTSLSPQEGTLVISNGNFHAAYETGDYSLLDIWKPGRFPITHPTLLIADASAWVDCYRSRFTDMTLAPGAVFYQHSNFVPASGRVTFDGGEYSIYLIQSYGHDWIPNQTSGSWTFCVTERGGRISDTTWRTTSGNAIRPELRAGFASGAATGKTAGELTLAFHNKLTIYRPLTTGGRIRLASGDFMPSADAVFKAACADGTAFGTGDLSFGCATLDFGELSSDYNTKFASHGEKIRLDAPALICGRYGSKTPQTFTFGDGVSYPFVREKGSCLVLSDAKGSKSHFDGVDVKAYVAGAKAPVDPNTRILKDPIVGASFFAGGGGVDIYRFDFLTQDADGLLKYDASVYTEGVLGGANSVARISKATTLSQNAQVAALNLDGYPLTINAGAKLKVGKDDTSYPAVVLTHHSTDSWGGNPCGNILGAGTLDFGASEGMVIAGRSDRTHRACAFNCRITGTGGLSVGGVTRGEAGSSVLSLGGNNDYTGGTRIGGAEVRVTSAGALSSGPVRLAGGAYTGGRVRFLTTATYANEWYANGVGAFLCASAGLEPGCFVFNADVTLTGPVHVDRFARFSTSPAMDAMSMSYAYTSGTGVFAGEISGGEVQVVGSHPSGYEKKPIVFTHHNSYTGGTMIAIQDLILRGDGDCGTGKVTMSNGSVLTFENGADKDFPNMLEGKGWVRLAGTAPVHFSGGVRRESWCDLKLDLADTAPIFTEAPPFGTVTNSVAALAHMTLKGDMALDPASYDYFEQNVRVKVDGGTVDLCGGTLTIERAELCNGGRFVNGELVETNPASGIVTIFR